MELLLAVLTAAVTASLVAMGSSIHVAMPLSIVLTGLPSAIYLGWAIWLAWGGSRLIWRLPVVLVFTAIVMGLLNTGSWRQEIVHSMLAIVGISLVAALPQGFGVRWINSGRTCQNNANSSNRRQFKLSDLFGWTAAVAIFAGLMRWGAPLGANPWREIVLILVSSWLLGVGALASMWAVMSCKGSVPVRVACVMTSSGLLAVAIVLATDDDLLPVAGFVETSLMFLMVGLYPLRRLGHRLVRAGAKLTG